MIDFSRNHFALFDLPERYRFDADQLERAYRQLQSKVHPDRFAAGSDQEKRISLQSSARVNEAYRVLRDPVERARYLLKLNGVDALDETDTELPLEFLERQLERRETAAGAVDNHDMRGLSSVAANVAEEASELEAILAQSIDAKRAYADAKVHVRQLKFLSKLAADLDTMHAELAD